MAALTAFSYLTLRHNRHVQRGIAHHVDKYVHMEDNIIPHRHHHCPAHKGKQQHAHRGNSLKCRSLYESGAEADDMFGERAPEEEAWKALKKKIEAFRGEFPQGEAFKAFKALVDQLDSSADPANPQMQLLLGQAKRFLKCPRAALVHYLNLTRDAETSENPQLGGWYLETGHACREAGDLEGALHFSSKALETCMERYGPTSLQVAQARSALSKIYLNLAKYEDSLREAQAARIIMKHLGTPQHAISLDLTLADTLVNLKRYQEAISILEEVIKSATGLIHINATINIAKAHAALGQNEHVKIYCEKALDALDHQEASNQKAANLLTLASLYEKREEFEQAALLLSKSIKMLEEYPGNNPQGMIAELESKVGRLFMRIRKAKEALPYLESSLSKKKGICGSLSHEQIRNGQELLYAHYYLGAAYSQCKRFQEALEQFEACMPILSDTWRGENPSFAMTVYNNAASMYHFLGSEVGIPSLPLVSYIQAKREV
eukprot:c23233_g1_i2 orf=383-1858(-)